MLIHHEETGYMYVYQSDSPDFLHPYYMDSVGIFHTVV